MNEGWRESEARLGARLAVGGKTRRCRIAGHVEVSRGDLKAALSRLRELEKENKFLVKYKRAAMERIRQAEEELDDAHH